MERLGLGDLIVTCTSEHIELPVEEQIYRVLYEGGIRARLSINS